MNLPARLASLASVSVTALLAAVMLTLTCALMVSPAQAGECEDVQQQCIQRCVAGNRGTPPRCQELCGPALAFCKLRVQQQAQAAAPAPTMPRLEAPLSQIEIAQAAKAVRDQRTQFAMDAYKRLSQNPPECSSSPGRMMDANACILARQRQRGDGVQGQQAAAVQQLLPVEQSYVMELAALPADALTRLQGVQVLADKYSSVSRLLDEILREVPRGTGTPSGNPVWDLTRRYTQRASQAWAEALAAPEVRQAWVEERLPSSVAPTDLLEAIEWGADRQTFRMKRSLGEEFGADALFANRRQDLTQSARERDQAAGFAAFGEPTANEIGLALLRVFTATGGRQTSAIESERSGPTTFLAVLLKAPVVDVNRIIHVQKVQPCTRTGEGFRCKVRVWLQVFQRGNGMRVMQGPNLGPGVQAVLAARAEAERLNGSAEDLVLQATRDGWSAPVLVERILAADAAKMQQMNDAARAARCASRPLFGPRWMYIDPECVR